MDPVFDSQYLMMKHSFLRDGTDIDIAYTPAGEVDYIYVVDRLLTVNDDDFIRQLQGVLPTLRRARDYDHEQYEIDGLVVLSLNDDHAEPRLRVPEALDLLDRQLGAEKLFTEHGEPQVTPVHVVHTAKLCAAQEPEVPCEPDPQPCPPPVPPDADQGAVRLGISDTGLWKQPPPGALHPWLEGVDGDDDKPGPIVTLPGPTLAGNQPTIEYQGGHGTFVAGVARCMALGATVYVANHFAYSGGEVEHVLVRKLEDFISTWSPDLINLSAGTYTRQNLPPRSFINFFKRHPDFTLVAAAGNDSTDRPFYPAAMSPSISVGALGADKQNPAWFSNHGSRVRVYAPGEGLVNAFATGVYTYQEPPKRPAQQVFTGMARGSGTSFSSPLVAGLIVAQMARSGSSAADAWQTVLGTARDVTGFGGFDGVSKVLLP